MVDKETGLWPRFQRVRRAVSEAMAGGKGKVNIYRWGGEDAGILDLAGQRLGEFGGVSVELKIKGTDSGWQQELEVDPSGDLHFTKRRGGSMNVEGLFRSPDGKHGVVQMTSVSGGREICEAYWLQTIKGAARLEQVVVNGRVYDSQDLEGDKEAEIPGTRTRVKRILPLK